MNMYDFLHSRDEYLCLSCFSVVVNLRDSHLKKVKKKIKERKIYVAACQHNLSLIIIIYKGNIVIYNPYATSGHCSLVYCFHF